MVLIKTNELLITSMAQDIADNTMTAMKAEVYSKTFDALKKAKSIGDYKSQRELDEQLARIEKLRAEAQLAKSKIDSDSTNRGTIELIIK